MGNVSRVLWQGSQTRAPIISCDLGSFRSNGGAQEGGGEDKCQGPSLGRPRTRWTLEVEEVRDLSQVILPLVDCVSES